MNVGRARNPLRIAAPPCGGAGRPAAISPSGIQRTQHTRRHRSQPQTARPHPRLRPRRHSQRHPGGKWSQRTSYPELDMAAPDTLASFLQSGLAAFPPAADRRHAIVFWDHGSGWAGYGIDHTCSPLKTYSERACDALSMDTLTRGGGRRGAMRCARGGRWSVGSADDQPAMGRDTELQRHAAGVLAGGAMCCGRER